MSNTPEMKQVWKEQFEKCVTFFNAVADELKETHTVIQGKSKKTKSACLVKKGKENEVSYYGKPINSLRVAINWNWRAGLDRCSNPKYIQCVTPDLPYCRHRPKEHPEWASPPVYGNMIGYFDTDNKYHCIFGEKYDHETKTWSWVDNSPHNVAMMILQRDAKLEQAMHQK